MLRHTQAFWLFLALNGAVVAQIQRPPVPPATQVTPSPASPTQPGAKGNVRLQFPNADVKDVLNLYQRIADVRLVYDNQVVGPVNIFIEGDLPADEARLIIEINLLMNGFTLVPVEGTKIVKVIGIGKSPRTAGIRIISDELEIPPGEEVVTYLCKLRYADPQEVSQVLGTFIVQAPGQYTNVTPLPKSSALLITENSAILRGIVKVIHEMDIPPAEVVDKFIALERADAEDVQKKLLEIFQKSPTPGQTGATPAAGAAANARTVARPPMPDGTQPPPGITAEQTGQNTIEISGSTLTEDAVIVGKITLTADKRTNRIHIVTRPVNMRFVEKLIREFDEDVKFGEPSIRKLKYVSASDIFQVVVKAITDPGAQDQSGAIAGGGAQRPTTTAVQPRTDSMNRAGGLGGGGAGGGSQTLSESLSATERDIVPDAVTVGNSRLIADKRANAIIVLGNQEVKDKVFKVIDELDVRAPQVLLHTVIGQLTLGNNEQFGVNYFISKANELGQNPAGAATGTGAGNLGNLFGLASIVAVGNDGAPSLNFNNLVLARNFETAVTAGSVGLTGFIAAGNSLDVILTALSSTNKFKVTARPSIFTSNNKKAIISSGEEIAIPSSIQSGFSGNAGIQGNNLVTNSTIQFKTVALQLEVLPLINADREVSLDIVQKLDEQVGTTRIDNNDIPRIATRVLQTSVSVPNRATLVLGGLIRQAQNKSETGIPYLSKIPLIGALFRSTKDDIARSELVILIRPEVTFGPEEDVHLREREQDFHNLPPDLEAGFYPNPTKIPTTGRKMLRRPSMPLRDSTTDFDAAPPRAQPVRRKER